MADAIDALTAFNEKDGSVNAIIETPKGSAIKYSYSPKSHLFRAKRTLPHGMVFPFNFGFVPGTLGEDGDPLDILIVDPEPFISGCLVRARLLAVIEAEQTEGGKMVRNDRIVSMAIDEETPPDFCLCHWMTPESGKLSFSLPPITESTERNSRRCERETQRTEKS